MIYFILSLSQTKPIKNLFGLSFGLGAFLANQSYRLSVWFAFLSSESYNLVERRLVKLLYSVDLIDCSFILIGTICQTQRWAFVLLVNPVYASSFDLECFIVFLLNYKSLLICL